MDREIRSIEKGVKKTEKSLKHLEKADKRRDRIVEIGKRALKKKP